MIVLTSLTLALGFLVLFDRIQHPAVRHTAVVEDFEHPEPPRDLAELSQVGQIVPEFVNVGGED